VRQYWGAARVAVHPVRHGGLRSYARAPMNRSLVRCEQVARAVARKRAEERDVTAE